MKHFTSLIVKFAPLTSDRFTFIHHNHFVACRITFPVAYYDDQLSPKVHGTTNQSSYSVNTFKVRCWAAKKTMFHASRLLFNVTTRTCCWCCLSRRSENQWYT